MVIIHFVTADMTVRFELVLEFYCRIRIMRKHMLGGGHFLKHAELGCPLNSEIKINAKKINRIICTLMCL